MYIGFSRRNLLSSRWIAATLCLLCPLSASPQAKRPAHTSRPAAKALSPVTATAPTARLDLLTHLQSAAVQSGDPGVIASSSRELIAEVLSLLGNIAAGEGRMKEAIDLDRQSLAMHADGALQLRLAALLARDGHPQEAVELARAAADAEPSNPRAWTTLGSALRSAGRDREAVASLTKALELDSNPSVAFALGSCLLAIHDKTRADQIFRRLIGGSDGAAIWHVAVGDAYREAGYLSEAAEEFRAALAKDPRATHAEFFLGLVNLQMNEWGPNSESFLHLRRSVEQNPQEYLSNFYLGALESTDGSDLAASDRHLLAATKTDPSEPEAWIYLGQNANRERRTDDAIRFLRKAIELTGADEARNHYQIRRAYFTLGRLLIARGDREKGERLLADYRRTEKLGVAQASASIAEKQETAQANPEQQPEKSSLNVLAGDRATATGALVDQPGENNISLELRSAERQLKTVLSSTYNDLGTAEARQQQYAQALQDFRQAEQWGTPAPPLLRNIASAAYRLNDSREVDRALTQYFATMPAPEDPRAHLMLAMSQFDLGRFGNAAANFKAAGDVAMGDSRAVYSYALSLARDGQAKEASTLADRLVASQLPTNLLALVCNVYFVAENFEGSAGCYHRVTGEDPSFRTAHYFVGESLIHLDRPADAVPELQQELTLTPDEPNVQSALAYALAQTSHKDEALALMRETVSKHPEHADSQYQLGKLLLEGGKAVDAVPHLEAAVSQDPTKDYEHYQLATAYKKLGRTADAEREFARYRQIKDKHRNDRAVPAGVQAVPVP